MPAQTSEDLAASLLRALGDPIRFRLLRELPSEDQAEIRVGDIARRLGVSDSVVSQHLRVLSAAGLVGRRKRGRAVMYHVNAAALKAARETLAQGMPRVFAFGTQQFQLSARNQLFGRISEIRLGDVSADITIDIGGQLVSAVITRASADRLELEVGDVAAAVFKAHDVIVLK